ncbi:ABC-F family ATP-binding cassette domain-containing protein [Pyrinomonas methylaliphatogenes]|uniref:ATPase component of ABC transporters with duplicated ATPase domain n=1 Tax=Pyrinomonas methylaliphatogenes TaxID=454194 RepID=A0A0B6WXJ4_9BACT|nr:ABC-F family ATP-binding cassette domain-containing protein [Pyrinomonas methylaliphatogenes]CDM65004.1 ATPase component of ABC transporters with duplicated ATPase domain [Pyrinomonas methylaliphatogenes]
MLFRLTDVRKAYGGQEVLRGLSLQVNAGERVGLVGRNGAGKTTIFRLIAGDEVPDSGEVTRARNIRLGMLAQHVEFEPDATVHEVALSAFGELQRIEREMRALEHRMAEGADDLERVLDRYSELQHRFEREGGFEYAARAEAVLEGLGFGRETWSLETAKLSGGQKNRLGLARLLLSSPDVLLLDEPTNHLDTAAVEWLEEFLENYPSAYVIISHDRYLLDRVCERIIEVEGGRATSYTGNYTRYIIEREARREAQRRAYEQQQEFIARTEEFIRRNIAGQKTKQAKSRRKMLERLERIEAVREERASGDFSLREIVRAGTQVLTLEDLSIGYDERALACGINLLLRRGESLGIIGPNGSGKTTFVKTLLGKLAPLAGEVRWGTNVRIGYYAQQLDDLDPRNEVIMELRRVAPSTATAGELRSFLARFLFTGDDVYKRVGDLSGGERGRLALAKLIYSRDNVLVLDEPTNHLDIPSREALEAALDEYPGTIIVISHDRYFLDRIVTQILAFDGQGQVEHFLGNYTEYHAWKKAQKAMPVEERKRSDKREHPRRKGGERRAEPARDVSAIEAEIEEQEACLKAVAEEMAKAETACDPLRLRSLREEYQRIEERLCKLYEEWEAIVAKVEGVA